MKPKDNNIIQSLTHNSLLLIAIVMLGMTFSSCNSDSITNSDSDNADDLYAVYWRLDTPDGRTNYVSLVDDLMDGKVDASEALEISGQSRFYAQSRSGHFFTGNGEELTITRYNISEEGKSIEKSGKFSLANQGVTSLQARTVFLSDTKAYYIDNTQGQIVIWNPEKMEIIDSFDLPEEFADGYKGYSTQLGFNGYQLNGNRLSIPVGWVNFSDATHLDKTGLAIVDTENNEVISYTEDTRCALATEPAFMPNGDVYYGQSERYHFSKQARKKENAGCILRKEAGANQFDQDYDPYMMDQIEGQKVGLSLFNSPKENHAYFRVLNTDKLEWSEDIEGINYYGIAWYTYEINLPKNEVIGKVDRPLGPSYAEQPFKINDDFYGTLKVNDEGEHKVIKYAPDGSYEEGLTTPGYISNLVRLR
ncbi:hypothetical protein [Fodinibius halophilus]|uniref:Uncharacterized protein n=1 Tax=Fodinibius halophilus TaxID=1736908 RepID=A0A6M1T160_9BACT|nr:hypothetical protein [Fodinibius halophilus]NGP87709.1 hypothetical protein [Fodinibius halophilus]